MLLKLRHLVPTVGPILLANQIKMSWMQWGLGKKTSTFKNTCICLHPFTLCSGVDVVLKKD